MIKRLFLATLFVLNFLTFFISKKVYALDSCSCGSGYVVTNDACMGDTPTCWGLKTLPLCSCRKTKFLCAGSLLDANDKKINTALGCIPVQMDKFMTWLLPYLFGISGSIAFLLMVYSFIIISTSKGDPKAIESAKETLTSAITGLLISIFAIFILRLIAVDILKIPGIS